MQNQNCKRKVLIVANAISGGGAEKSSLALYEYLVSHGVDATFCALNESPLPKEFQRPASIIVLNRRWKAGFTATVSNFWQFLVTVSRSKPDVILINCELPELYIAFLRKRRKRVVIIEHTSKPWFKRRLLGFFVRLIITLKRCEWVTVSKGNQQIWPFNSKAVYIPNSVAHVEETSRDVNSERTREEEKRLIFIGRLTKAKRAFMVIQAGARLGIPVDVFGEGPERQQLESLASSTLTRVKIFGFIENPWKLISHDSLVVVPSEFEGDGLVVVEAISNGNPILLSDNADLRRFCIPDSHFFTSQQELEEKILHWTLDKGNLFKVGDSSRLNLIKERELSIVGQAWMKFLHLT
jgi:glycosyltransferase involved in cell wall biosynthesis